MGKGWGWALKGVWLEHGAGGVVIGAVRYAANDRVNLNTHDLAWFGGWQSQSDLKVEREIGLETGETDEDRARATRAPGPCELGGGPAAAGYQQKPSGMTLSAAVRGGALYLATASPGSDGSLPNDHIILVTDALLPSASLPAP